MGRGTRREAVRRPVAGRGASALCPLVHVGSARPVAARIQDRGRWWHVRSGARGRQTLRRRARTPGALARVVSLPSSPPDSPRLADVVRRSGWSTEVSLVAYGHPCRKRTWLYCAGVDPPALDWSEPPALASISDWGPGNTRRRGEEWEPGIQYDEASRSPLAFRDALLDIARSGRSEPLLRLTRACPPA